MGYGNGDGKGWERLMSGSTTLRGSWYVAPHRAVGSIHCCIWEMVTFSRYFNINLYYDADHFSPLCRWVLCIHN